MDLATCKKYIGFVHEECERHLEDGRVTDDEIYQLIIEFNRFQEKVAESDLPADLKEKIAAVDFEYTRSGVKWSSGFLILALITLGIWALVFWWRRQQRRKRTLENIEYDMDALVVYMKMHHE